LSITQKYLLNTNKKNTEQKLQTFAISNYNMDQSIAMDKSGSFDIMAENNNQSSKSGQEPILNHILKQINSLKVENLELKKMMR
jgi:hypothetical protein